MGHNDKKPFLMLKRYYFLFLALFILFSACDLFSKNREGPVITIGERRISEDEIEQEIKKVVFEMGINEKDLKAHH